MISSFLLLLISIIIVGNAHAKNFPEFDDAITSYLPVQKITLDEQQAQNYTRKGGDQIFVAKSDSEIRKHIKSWNVTSEYNYIQEMHLNSQISEELASQGIFLFEIRSGDKCHACGPKTWILDSRKPTPSITELSLSGKWGMVDKDIRIKKTKGSIYLAQTGGDMHQGYISTYVSLDAYSLNHRTSRSIYLKKYSTDSPVGTNDGHAGWDHKIEFLNDGIRILTVANINSCVEQNVFERIISAVSNSCTNNSVSEFEDLIFYANE